MSVRNLIIGAGITGLALGWYLKKHFREQKTVILEANNRPGGWIRSSLKDGFLFEEGPHSCRTRGAGIDTLKLVEELDLCHEVIQASPEASKRYLYLDSKLQKVPNSLFSFLTSPLTRGMFSAFWKEWRTLPGNMEDESVADFILRRMNRQVAEKFIDPLVSGIYAGDIHQLSFRSCFPELHRIEQVYGSLIKGMLRKKKADDACHSAFVRSIQRSPIFTFKNGMETLVQALYQKLEENIELSVSAEAIHINKEEIGVKLSDGRMIEGNRIFLAIPAHSAAKLLKGVAPRSAEILENEKSATAAVVNMGWNRKVLKQEGFGYLVPSSEKQEILGCIFDSSAFPEQNVSSEETRLTVMLGGMHHPEIDLTEQSLKKKALRAIQHHLGIFSEPDAIHVSLAKQAIPQYTVGYQKRILVIQNEINQLSNFRIHLCGSAWQGVAVNDCISEAKKLIESLRIVV